MTHPDWALKHKTKGSELRCINGRYYFYKVSSIWDKQKKSSRKITGEMIGRITEDEGLIYQKERKKQLKKHSFLKTLFTV